MGNHLSVLGQSFPSKSNFHVEDIPDLTGKVMIVTGANTGIGKETAKVLLTHNAKVYVAARSQEKAEVAIKDLKNSTGKEALFLKLDLADLKSVKACAEEYLSKETTLDVLFNSAGVMFPPTDWLTVDGYDLQFGTNVLGHFYFTKLLLPTLIATAKSAPDGKARVITTSSSAHVLNGLNFSAFKDSPTRKKMSTSDLYGQSKTGNIVQAFELARRYSSEGIVSIPLNPGNIKTDLARHMPSFLRSILNLFLYDVEHGALTQLYAGTVPEAVELNGKYLVPWARVGPTRRDARDPKVGEALWEWLEEQVKDI
ncbi:uncharacterized protein BJ212DRAFT_1456374 [Suillus subaureus]|uniref:NAD(P)-binding protein n=1 Tax=Suillus subaureus TaxID=48587 RepID=A0A9P7JHG5_9AGAM|nr:uncharacterized protein BJ212DRAFT_1456374 [Suillus subaureus]KAG1822689.1 hypothetical protein BJ212DRAFT_1456374 [Suillus subaureus]